MGVRYWIDPKTNKRLRLCNACGEFFMQDIMLEIEGGDPGCMCLLAVFKGDRSVTFIKKKFS